MNWYTYNREEEEERQKRLGITPQYINTPYGIVRNPDLDNKPETIQQTQTPSSSQTQPQQASYTPVNDYFKAQEVIHQNQHNYEDKYNNSNPLVNGLKALNKNDWQDVGIATAKGIGLGAEKLGDAATLGTYALIDRYTGGDYAQRNQQYHQQAQETGVGELAKLNDRIIDIYGSNTGFGKISKYFHPTGKYVGKITDDIMSSAITQTNRAGKPFEQEELKKGAKNSNILWLLEYLKNFY